MNLYYCYSTNVRKFLTKRGFKYLHSGLHNKTKMTFWVYPSSEELQKALNEYSANRENAIKQREEAAM